MILGCLHFATDTTAFAQQRTFTDISGKFHVNGEFVELNGEIVVLQTTDGKQISVSLYKLSDADLLHRD